jgi:O-antigen ligase
MINTKAILTPKNKALDKKADEILSSQIIKFPKWLLSLLYLLSIYLVLPIIDFPLLGLSLSALLFFFIATFVILKSPKNWIKVYRKWIILAVLIWFGIFFAAVLNGLLSGGVDIDSAGLKTVVRYVYWLLVFVVIANITCNDKILRKISSALGWSIFFLGILRLGEALILGNIGVWSGTQFLTQNSYGFQFSTFSPFLLIKLITEKGIKRVISGFALIIVWSAAAINGSRSSWIAMIIGLVVTLVILFLTKPKKFLGVLIIFIILISVGIIFIFNNPDFTDSVINRVNTLENIQSDRTYTSRIVLNQKSIKLFQISPIIGVGAGRFRLETVPLDIPILLSHLPVSHFDTKTSHNSYLGFLAENGLVGGLPLAILLLLLFIQGVRSCYIFSSEGKYWSIGIIVAFIQMSIHMWTIFALTGTSTWFVFGLVCAMIMLENQNKLKKQYKHIYKKNGVI